MSSWLLASFSPADGHDNDSTINTDSDMAGDGGMDTIDDFEGLTAAQYLNSISFDTSSEADLCISCVPSSR
jgi:hypothetical protein